MFSKIACGCQIAEADVAGGWSRRAFVQRVTAIGALSTVGIPAWSQATVFRCPPCGCAMDGKDFDAPGRCPACGMALVPADEGSKIRTPDGRSISVERGQLEVPENRNDLGSRRITLHYLRLRSSAAKPAAPIVYLAGGPGASGIAAARGSYLPIFAALTTVSDVILLDQRGVGASNAIPTCPDAAAEAAEISLTREALTAHYRSELQRCWSWWKGRGIAIDAYNTRESAADLDDLRRALGVAKISLFGLSYGSHLALAAIKYHREGIERVLLSGVEGLDQTVKLPARIDEVLGRIEAATRATPANAKASDLRATMRRVHERLDRTPARVSLPGSGTAPAVTLVVSGFSVQMIAGQFLNFRSRLSQLPAFYRALDAGDYSVLAQIHAATGRGYPPITGMTSAMDLASGISKARLSTVRAEAPTALLGDAMNFPVPQLHDLFPQLDLGDEFRSPVATDLPALLIAGTLDGRTPLAEQQAAARGFTRANWIFVENAGHDAPLASQEIPPLIARFFRGEPIPSMTLHAPPIDFAR